MVGQGTALNVIKRTPPRALVYGSCWEPQFSSEQYRLARMKALHAMLITIFDLRKRDGRMSTEVEVIADMGIELAELSIAEQGGSDYLSAVSRAVAPRA